VKGIGKKTLLDIKAQFDSIEDIVRALKAGEHISLRDDVVEILRKELL